MRVLHAISGLDPQNGGPTSVLVGLAEAQARAGLSVSVVATWQLQTGFETAERLRGSGVPVTMIGPATGRLSRHPDLRGTLDELVRRADVVHVHAIWEEIQYQACRSALRHRVPYVVTPHGMLDPWNFTKGRCKKTLYMILRMRRHLDRAAAMHFATEMEREWASRMRLQPATLVEGLGLDLREFRELPARGAFRAAHPRIGDRPLVVFLGRIHPGKGLEVLVPAMARLRENAAAVLAVVGPDPIGFQPRVEALAAEHGLGDRVIFTGMLRGADRLTALVDADVFALPSYHENFGVAVAEALACGTPAIVSDQVGLHREIARAGVGEIAPAAAGAFAAVLDRWLGDPARRHEAGAKAREYALGQYDWDKVAARWIRHYERLVDGATMAGGCTPVGAYGTRETNG